jgi:hypothetical protein
MNTCLASFFITYMHINCFLTFQYGIIIYSLHPHKLFLNFRCEITILHFMPHFFITYIHMYCFLIFQFGITIYGYIHMHLIFRCGITIHSLYPFGLFLNFLMWDNYIWLHSHVLFFNFSMWDNYITLDISLL